MQTIVVAVQNAVSMSVMGVATSAVTFTRSLGGAVGTAAFGALLNSRLSSYLAEELGGEGVPITTGNPEAAATSIQSMQSLDEPMRTIVLGAYTNAVTDLFVFAIPAVVLAFVISLFLKEIPLRSGKDVQDAPVPAAH